MKQGTPRFLHVWSHKEVLDSGKRVLLPVLCGGSMRYMARMLISALFLAFVSVVGAASGPSTEVTPEKMAGQGFSIKCRFIDHTITEGVKPTRRTGVITVQVLFDVEKGPRIKEMMNSAELVVRDGDEVILGVPVLCSGGEYPVFIQFVIHERMLPNASIGLTKREQNNPPSFVIPLQKFRSTP